MPVSLTDKSCVPSRAHADMGGAVIVVEHDIGRFNRQTAAARHRVARVDHEVCERRFELAQVSANRRDVGRTDNPQIDVLANELTQHARQRVDGVVEIHARRVQHLPAAKRQQLTRQRRRAVRRGENLGGVPRRRLILGDLLGDERAEADNRRENVVEVVRDPAGQLADRFHLLRLIKLALQPLPVGKDGRQLRLAFPQRFRCSPLGFARRRRHAGEAVPAFDRFNDVRASRVGREERRNERTCLGIGVHRCGVGLDPGCSEPWTLDARTGPEHPQR